MVTSHRRFESAPLRLMCIRIELSGKSDRSSTGRSWVRFPLVAFYRVDLAQSVEQRFEEPPVLVQFQESTSMFTLRVGSSAEQNAALPWRRLGCDSRPAHLLFGC